MPLGITYNAYNTTFILNNVDMLNDVVSTFARRFEADEYIESILLLMVTADFVINQTAIECFMADLGSDSEDIHVNISGDFFCSIVKMLLNFNYAIEPLVPTGFRFTGEYHQFMNTTLTFEWDSPQGIGPETIVDNYTITISPSPPLQPNKYRVMQPPWIVTLTHNTIYSINITAANCAGESAAFEFSEIEYGKQMKSVFDLSYLTRFACSKLRHS